MLAASHKRWSGQDGLKTRERSKEERQKEREEKRKAKAWARAAEAGWLGKLGWQAGGYFKND